MAQIKIFARRDHIDRHRAVISDTVHEAMQRVMGLPAMKRFHRFIAFDPVDMLAPPDRSDAYTIIEIIMFEGRKPETKNALLHALMDGLAAAVPMPIADIEITLIETPRANWGIRGQTGEELALNYKVET